MTNPTIQNLDPTGIRLGDNEYQEITVASGQDLAAGSVLGLITSSQLGSLVALASNDGSQNARFVLPHALDTSATGTNTDTATRVIKSGLVRADRLVFGTGGGIDVSPTNATETSRESLRNYGILAEDRVEQLNRQDNQ
jgi:hypothetical protein